MNRRETLASDDRVLVPTVNSLSPRSPSRQIARMCGKLKSSWCRLATILIGLSPIGAGPICAQEFPRMLPAGNVGHPTDTEPNSPAAAYPREFRLGYLRGYVDVVQNGGTGESLLPPTEVWNSAGRDENADYRIIAWLTGHAAGMQQARQDGVAGRAEVLGTPNANELSDVDTGNNLQLVNFASTPKPTPVVSRPEFNRPGRAWLDREAHAGVINVLPAILPRPAHGAASPAPTWLSPATTEAQDGFLLPIRTFAVDESR